VLPEFEAGSRLTVNPRTSWADFEGERSAEQITIWQHPASLTKLPVRQQQRIQQYPVDCIKENDLYIFKSMKPETAVNLLRSGIERY